MFSLPPLPYAETALAPYMSADTLTTHHKKHHSAYVAKTNDLLRKSKIGYAPLEDVIRQAHELEDKPLFNNAAQAWNHAFFWLSMTPSQTAPDEAVEAAMAGSFGSMDGLRSAFLDRGGAHFGSGWLWLVQRGDGKLDLRDLHDAGTPLTVRGERPLLCCDLWEHAYYLDHRQERAAYLSAFFDHLLDWRFVGAQVAARGADAGWRFPKPSAAAA